MKKKKETQDKVVSILEQYIIKAYADDKTIDVPFVADADPKPFITNKPLGEDTELEEDFLVDDPEEFGYEEGELDGEVGDEKEPPYEEGGLNGEVDEGEPENYKEVDWDLDDDEDLEESLMIEQETKKKDEEDVESEDKEEKKAEEEAPEDLATIAAEEPTGVGEELPADTKTVPGAEGSPEELAAAAGNEAGMEAAGDVPSAGMDPTMAGMTDPSMGANIPGMGMDQGMMGISSPPTAEQIGRIFELKKIYSRLLSIEQYLSFTSDEFLLNLKEYISKAIELFETLIFNLDSFKNKLDDIIVLYYTFVQSVYQLLDKYYKKKEKDLEEK
jgi:hypothetical protein